MGRWGDGEMRREGEGEKERGGESGASGLPSWESLSRAAGGWGWVSVLRGDKERGSRMT